MIEPLSVVKLHVPQLPEGWVARPSLVKRLDTGLGHKLTLISAPAGFGKTTLLAEWVYSHQDGMKAGCPLFAWLSLDKDANERERFWMYFVAAVRETLPDVGESCVTMLETGKVPSVRAVVTRLANDIAAEQKTLVVVMDDFQEITRRSIQEDVAFLLDRLPPQAHLAVATRADPVLPLARLRSRGQLAELRAGDLRFSIAEATTFLNETMALGLSDDDVVLLKSRTEGWVASLKMAALSMRGRPDCGEFVRRFDGTHRHIEDYLMEEVIGRQEAGVQSFLMQTSILDRFNSALCDSVTGRDDSQETIEYLERANLFLTPMDDSRRWFRYHGLFAELMRKRLARIHPDLMPTLHKRASLWWEGEGLKAEAVHHALAAEDFERAADLIESVAEPLVSSGRLFGPRMWLSNLPTEVIRSRPALCAVLGGVHMAAGRLDAGESLLDRADFLLSRSNEQALRQPVTTYHGVRNYLNAIRALMVSARGNIAESIRMSEQTLREVPADQPVVLCMLTFCLGANHWMKGELAKASYYLEQAVSLGRNEGNSFIALVAMAHLSDVCVKEGRLRRAAKICREAISVGTEWGGGEPLAATAYAHICLGCVLYQWNKVDEAIYYVNRGIELGQQGAQMTISAMAIPALASLSGLTERAKSVSEALGEVMRIASNSRGFVAISRMAGAWEARLALARGDIEEAEVWITAHKSHEADSHQVPDYVLEFEHLTLVRLKIAKGDTDGLIETLESLRCRGEEQGGVGVVMETLVLEAIILEAQDRPDDALVRLERALSLAEPEGFVRVFVDEGQPMAALLRHAAARGVRRRYVSKLLAASDETQLKQTSAESPVVPAEPLVEPLTEREYQVLQLLAAGKSNRQIAEELVVVAGTVKAHLLHIYSKLNVHSRTQAVARSRDLNLI